MELKVNILSRPFFLLVALAATSVLDIGLICVTSTLIGGVRAWTAMLSLSRILVCIIAGRYVWKLVFSTIPSSQRGPYAFKAGFYTIAATLLCIIDLAKGVKKLILVAFCDYEVNRIKWFEENQPDIVAQNGGPEVPPDCAMYRLTAYASMATGMILPGYILAWVMVTLVQKCIAPALSRRRLDRGRERALKETNGQEV